MLEANYSCRGCGASGQAICHSSLNYEFTDTLGEESTLPHEVFVLFLMTQFFLDTVTRFIAAALKAVTRLLCSPRKSLRDVFLEMKAGVWIQTRAFRRVTYISLDAADRSQHHGDGLPDPFYFSGALVT